MTQQSKRKKGSMMESEAAEAFTAYLNSNPNNEIIGTWKSRPQRFASQDMYQDWDLSFAVKYCDSIIVDHRIQVKSVFSKKYYLYLVNKWKNSLAHSWLAVYQKNAPKLPATEMWANKLMRHNPKGESGTKQDYLMRLGVFWFVRVS